MYAGGGEFTESINKMGGEGTADLLIRLSSIFVGDFQPTISLRYPF